MSATTRLEDMPIVAACAFVPRSDGKIIVFYDLRRRGSGLPAGTIDPGETPLECALRELKEETTVEAVGYQEAPFYDGITDTGKRAQVFLVCAWNGEPTSSVEGEAYWADPRELISAKAAYPFYNGEVLKRLRQHE